MKKLFAIALIAACFTACNGNGSSGSTSDSTSVSTDSGTMSPSPASVDTNTLRTDTSGPRQDSGMRK